MTDRRGRAQRRHAFVEQQLKAFYSPLLGLRAEVRMPSELREGMYAVANEEWQKLCADACSLGPEALQALSDARFPEFSKITDYGNTQLLEALLPAYRQMVRLFRENQCLAAPDTRAHFRTLIEYVDIWDRWMAKVLPREVLAALDQSEDALRPFYEHLEQKHDELQQILSSGKA